MAQNGHVVLDRDFGTADLPVDTNAVREQVRRILSDPLFHNSRRYSDMLAYIVDRTLDRQYDCLKERVIGYEVFERPADYDPSVDSIVRVAAAEIRKRLSRYYHESGRDHELRIELPTRSYVAEFKLPGPAVQELPIRSVQSIEEQPVPREQTSINRKHGLRNRHIYIVVAVAASILIFASWAAQHIFGPARAIDKFWAPVLNSPGPTLIALGSPVWIKSSPAAGNAAPGSPEPGIPFFQFITHQVNFPLADLSAASAITTFLARRGEDSVIRLSDSTTLSDLRGNPLIVLGSFPNEWALRLGDNLPFQFRHDAGLQWIEDTSHPADRTWMVNMRSPYEQVTSEYALITRAMDQTTGQWWIGIGGVTVLGTNAAQQMMTDPKEMTAFVAQLPQGWERKHLQVVIEVKMVKGSPGASRIIATRTW